MDELHELNDVVLDQAADGLVQDFLLKALIATHPHPERVLQAFEAMALAHKAGLQDLGFDRGSKPRTVFGLQQRIEKRVSAWRQAFPQG